MGQGSNEVGAQTCGETPMPKSPSRSWFALLILCRVAVLSTLWSWAIAHTSCQHGTDKWRAGPLFQRTGLRNRMSRVRVPPVPPVLTKSMTVTLSFTLVLWGLLSGKSAKLQLPHLQLSTRRSCSGGM